MRTFVLALTLAAAAIAVPRAQVPSLHLTFDNGVVTIVATDAPLSDIVAEWARVGGTRVTGPGLEALAGTRVTLKMTAPEAEVLQTLVGSTTGYIFTRRADAAPDRSTFSTLILAGGSTRSNTAAPVVLPPAVKAAMEINTDIPEAKYQYPEPMPELLGELLRERDASLAEAAQAAAERARTGAKPEPYIMPEARYKYPDPPAVEPPIETPEEPKIEEKADPKTKKPPQLD